MHLYLCRNRHIHTIPNEHSLKPIPRARIVFTYQETLILDTKYRLFQIHQLLPRFT